LAEGDAEVEELFVDRFFRYALSRSGDKLAYLRETGDEGSPDDGRVWAVDLTTGERVGLAEGWLTCDAWSGDGRYLILELGSDNPSYPAVCVFDTDGRKLAAHYKTLNADFFSWSPSANYVAFGRGGPPKNLRVIDVETGEGWTVEGGEAAFLCWVGGSRFFYSHDGKLYSYNCDTRGGRVVYAWFSGGDCEVLTWISDSHLIFTHGPEDYMDYGYGGLHLLDVRTGAHRVLAPGNGHAFFFDDGGDLVFRTEGMAPGYPEYWELDLTTGYVAPYERPDDPASRRSSTHADGGAVSSPDGGRVAVLEEGKLTLRDADGSNVVTLMEEGRGINVIEYGHAGPKAPVWSSAGDKVAWVREGYGLLPGKACVGPFTEIWAADRDGSDVHVVLKADAGTTLAPRHWREF
jgi:hypothetical protein